MEAVHPPDWTHPTPSGKYNLVVIGAGTAGLVCAAAAAGLGAKVALIERHLMGGDCLNVGCVPSKGVIRAGRAAADLGKAAEFGIHAQPPAPDFAALMQRVRRVRANIATDDGAERFRKLGVDVYFGHARFSGPRRVEVDGCELDFARAVIATGTRPAIPPISGLAEASFVTNEQLFDLDSLPRRLAVIGGGPIGCEMAQSFARLGSEVTLIEAAPSILGNDDPEAAAIVADALRRDGVKLLVSTLLERVEDDGSLTIPGGTIETDQILVAAGRRPNVEDLGLEVAGVETTPQGVAVDARLRTSNRRIYAAGDIASPFRFTHAADAMARIAVRNALFFGRAKLEDVAIPWVTYTSPELAHVGRTPASAAADGVEIDTYEVALADVHRAQLDAEAEGFIKVHTRRGTDRIVGATLVSAHAGETISEVALAMQSGIGLGKISATVHPYPTQALALKRAADAYARTRLTPRVARFLRWLLAWRRR